MNNMKVTHIGIQPKQICKNQGTQGQGLMQKYVAIHEYFAVHMKISQFGHYVLKFIRQRNLMYLVVQTYAFVGDGEILKLSVCSFY